MAPPALRGVKRASLYTYYRIDPARREELRAVVDALFAAAAQAYGVQGRWMRRKDDPSTYLEVYADVENVAALAAFVQRECARIRFARLLADGGARHDEIFVDAD
jgi:quinol monooxygenase YgiN